MSPALFRINEHVVPAQHIREYPRGSARSQNEELFLKVKQYTPKVQTGSLEDAVTIVATHANGFPKELYEPFWDELLRRIEGRFVIRSIWIADIVGQGESYVLNESTVGNEPSWYDHSRDLLHMINHFRAEMPRPLVGIGHSFGGTQLVNLSLFHPRLFDALVLLDPVVDSNVAPDDGRPKPGALRFGPAGMSTFRRDIWPSRQAAREAFLKSSFYQAWDRRVFERWMDRGLRDLPTAVYPEAPPSLQKDKAYKPGDTPVTLATTKHQEVWTFLRPDYSRRGPNGEVTWSRKHTPDIGPLFPWTLPMYRPEPQNVFRRLPMVRPPVFYILGELSSLTPKHQQRDKVIVTGIGEGGSGGLAEGRVEDVTLKGVGHLVPMEAPDQSAQLAADWLDRTYRQWKESEEEWRAGERRRPQSDHITVDEEWMAWMTGKKGGKGPSKL